MYNPFKFCYNLGYTQTIQTTISFYQHVHRQYRLQYPFINYVTKYQISTGSISYMMLHHFVLIKEICEIKIVERLWCWVIEVDGRGRGEEGGG